MSFQDISNDLELTLQKKLGCKFSYILMRYKDKVWAVESTADKLTEIRSKFYEARNNYGPKTILEVVPFPDIEQLNRKYSSTNEYPSKEEINKIDEIEDEAEEIVICEDDSCIAYQLEQSNDYLIKFIRKYVKYEK